MINQAAVFGQFKGRVLPADGLIYTAWLAVSDFIVDMFHAENIAKMGYRWQPWIIFAIFVDMSRQDFYNLAQLKERGWTPSMVKKLIDIPPTEFKGMYARQPQKCYPNDYIEMLEQSELFNALKMKAAGRQAAMKAVADTKRADNIAKFSARVDSVKIPTLTEDELKMRTIKSKQRWYAYQSELRCEVDDGIDIEHLPANVLHRWEVNYIRHELTRYEKLMGQIRGLVGTRDIYTVIKGEILDKIATAYPWLKDECDRQKEDIV